MVEVLSAPSILQINTSKYRPFGPLLRELRQSRKLTVVTLARTLRTQKGYVSGIETGKVRPPSPKYIARIARYFKVDENYLLLLSYAEKAPNLIRDQVMQSLWPEVPLLEESSPS